jgi:hypothetical protein
MWSFLGFWIVTWSLVDPCQLLPHPRARVQKPARGWELGVFWVAALDPMPRSEIGHEFLGCCQGLPPPPGEGEGGLYCPASLTSAMPRLKRRRHHPSIRRSVCACVFTSSCLNKAFLFTVHGNTGRDAAETAPHSISHGRKLVQSCQLYLSRCIIQPAGPLSRSSR